MEETFVPQQYVKCLGKELVIEFEKAGIGTHPHAVGTAKELSVKEKLKNILPAGVGIGSGFVIDSFGNTTGQCDIIIYEENFALKFAINGDTSNAYYNCESVIAVGEVKSKAGTKEVKDAINKLQKVNQLIRYNKEADEFRKYFSPITIQGTSVENKDETLDQIFTFFICQELNVNLDTIKVLMCEKCKKDREFVNRIVDVDGRYICYASNKDNFYKTQLGRANSEIMFEIKNNEFAFNHFISNLIDFIIYSRTVPLNYGRYLATPINVNDIVEMCKL